MLAGPLGALAAAHPAVAIGCYPFNRDGRAGANLVLRSPDAGALAAAEAAVADMIAGDGRRGRLSLPRPFSHGLNGAAIARPRRLHRERTAAIVRRGSPYS